MKTSEESSSQSGSKAMTHVYGRSFHSIPKSVSRLINPKEKTLMAQQNYRVENGVGMWLRSQPVVDEASKMVLLPHGQLVTKLADTNNPDWWQVATTFQGQNLQGFCKHALMVADSAFQAPP